MYKSSYKDWVATYTFSLWSVLHQYIITVLLHWVALYKLTFEIPTTERRYCYLYAHNLLNFSFSTLQFNPEDKTAGAIQGQILLFFWGILKGKEVRAQALPSSCWQLSSVAACIQLCGRLRLWNQSNTVGKPPIVFLHVPAEMRQPWHRSHSNTKMGAPCFLWLYIHQQRGRSLSRVWGDNCASCSGICSPHILVFLTAEKFVLIHGGSWMLSKMLFQSPLPVEDFIQSVQALVSVFSSNLPTSWRGLELAGMISS